MTADGDGSDEQMKAGAEVDATLAAVLRIARDNSHPGQFEAIRWLIRCAYAQQQEEEKEKNSASKQGLNESINRR